MAKNKSTKPKKVSRPDRDVGVLFNCCSAVVDMEFSNFSGTVSLGNTTIAIEKGQAITLKTDSKSKMELMGDAGGGKATVFHTEPTGKPFRIFLQLEKPLPKP